MENKEFIKAVQFLKGNGTIRRDKDIADKTKYNKTTISTYLNGKIKASENFIKEFERVFYININKIDKKKGITKLPSVDKIDTLIAITKVNQKLMIELLANNTGKTVIEINNIVKEMTKAELKKIH